MKKRLRGLLALCIMSCMMLAATTSAVSAATYDMYIAADARLSYDGGRSFYSGNLFAGDKINGDGCGGAFIVIDQKNNVIGQGSSPVYYKGSEVPDLECFYLSSQYTVSPPLSGYYCFKQTVLICENYTGGSPYPVGDMLNNLCWLKALQLTPLPFNYTVKYDANEGDAPIGAEPEFSFTYADEASLSGKTISDGSGFTNNDQVVGSWNTDPEGNGASIKPGASLKSVQATIAANATAEKVSDARPCATVGDTIPTGEATITLYAQWTDPPPPDDPSSDDPTKDTSNKSSDNASGKSPATGDSDIPMAALLLMLASAAVVGAFLFRRRSSPH